jgi:hypothetical protein
VERKNRFKNTFLAAAVPHDPKKGEVKKKLNTVSKEIIIFFHKKNIRVNLN